jgi:hypothetical protein
LGQGILSRKTLTLSAPQYAVARTRGHIRSVATKRKFSDLGERHLDELSSRDSLDIGAPSYFPAQN